MRRKPNSTASRCVACGGRGTVEDRLHTLIQQLCVQMQRVADAMQAGDAERAAHEARHAARVAITALEPGTPPSSPRVTPTRN
jgi:hypothetical protein